MSSYPWHPSRSLRDHNPAVRHAPIVTLGPEPLLWGKVTVCALELSMGRNSSTDPLQYEIIASWQGRPLPGTPTPAPGVNVSASDCYVTPDLRHAKAIAGHAYQHLRAGQIPDLRAIARQLAELAEPAE